jgi:uncharacterized linocin/CFP29 family protein
MTQNNPQVPWTDEQWARVNQVIQEEASRARVAATFLPLLGPLPADTDFVREERISYGNWFMTIDDKNTIQLATLQVKVHIRGAQVADPELTSVLALFRRAANVLARLEDAIIFKGQPAVNEPPAGSPGRNPGAVVGGVWEVMGGQRSLGLFDAAATRVPVPTPRAAPPPPEVLGNALVPKVSECISTLESQGHFGPFAMVLGNKFFEAAQTPERNSLVLPQDRIIPLLGGGSLLRSSQLNDYHGVMLALGGTPVELVVASDMACEFLQVTQDPVSIFRVREKIALRIKENNAIVRLTHP